MVNSVKIEQEIEKNLNNAEKFKHTIDDWHSSNYLRFECSEVQQSLAKKLLEKSNRLCKFTNDKVKSNRDKTNQQLKSRINEVENFKQDLITVRNELPLEIDALITYRDRLKNSLTHLRQNALAINKKCLTARERRIGIDLVNDEVELELRKECEKIKCADELMSETLEKAEEQIRQTKAAMYFIDRDLEDKENNLRIDRHNSTLKETNLNLSIYCGKSALTISNISTETWEEQTKKNIENSIKELANARKTRSIIDRVLRKIISDLTNQKKTTDEVLRHRIEETKETKTKLELQHSNIMYQANEMAKNITKLEKMIAEKEGFIALVHTRLGNRCQRPGLELTYDSVEKSLIKEISDLREVVSELQQTLFEAQASLRFLLKIQVQLEEDINIKTNSLNIDEVYCLTNRESIDYHVF